MGAAMNPRDLPHYDFEAAAAAKLAEVQAAKAKAQASPDKMPACFFPPCASHYVKLFHPRLGFSRWHRCQVGSAVSLFGFN